MKGKALSKVLWMAAAVMFIMAVAFVPMAEAGTKYYYSGTGHLYEPVLVTGGITWGDAKTAAEAAGGYLATITSAGENDFVYGLVSDSAYWWHGQGPWLGGYQPEGSSEPDGGWTWVTGETWSYTNWNVGEPNNMGNENALHYVGSSNRWNDIHSATLVNGYIIEFDCLPPPSSMFSWWRAENNANDSIGTNHGTLMNDAAFAAGRVGQAFSFDGVNDYVTTEDGPDWDLGVGDFTIDGWINTNTPNATMRLIAAGSRADGAFNLWFFGYGYASAWGSGNRLNFGYYDADGYPYTDLNSDEITISPNTWYHIAVVRSGTEIRFYLNGTQVGSQLIGTVSISGGSTGVIIGARYLHNSSDVIEFAQGFIDEVEIFRRALSLSEIQAIYNAGSAGKCFTADTTPDQFIFTDKTVVDLNTNITSNPITVSGINSATNISITSCTGTNCEYQINSGAWTSGAGTVLNGDTVTVRQTSSASHSTTTDLTLDIGGVIDTFSVTTMAPPQRILTVTKAGTGTGTVMAGANCTLNWVGNTGTCTVNSGTSITLSGAADTGSTFAGWSSGTGSASACTGTGNCAFNITADSRVTATFTLNQYTITASANPTAGGGVTCSPNPVNHGSTSTCTVTTNTGYTLQSVSGTCGGNLSGNTYTTNAITSNCTVVANFIGTYTLSGRVTIQRSGAGLFRSPVPLSGVTITLSGTSAGTAITDSNGNYIFTGLISGNYIIVPSLTGYAFTPVSRSVNISNANVINQNFTARAVSATFSVSGTVRTDGGAPIQGVTMTLSGAATGTTMTDANGNYSFTGLVNGRYTVTPSLAGHTFTPLHRSVVINNANRTGLDFTGAVAPAGYSISGTVRTRVLGVGASGVTITLSGTASQTTTTDGSGNYSFAGLTSGNYTVTPSQTGHTFTPASRAVTIINTNVIRQNFIRH